MTTPHPEPRVDCDCTAKIAVTFGPLSAEIVEWRRCPLHQGAKDLLEAGQLAYGVLSGQLGGAKQKARITARLLDAITAATVGKEGPKG